MATTRTEPKGRGFTPEPSRQPEPDNTEEILAQAHLSKWKPGDPKLPGFHYPGDQEYEAERTVEAGDPIEDQKIN